MCIAKIYPMLWIKTNNVSNICLDLFFHISKICFIISSAGKELIAIKAEKDL